LITTAAAAAEKPGELRHRSINVNGIAMHIAEQGEGPLVAGHDWGAAVASNAAILRPDVVRAVVLLSVPFTARSEGGVKPTERMRLRVPPGMQFYQTYFQEPGLAERVMQADPNRTLRMMLYSASGSIPNEHRFRPVFGVKETVLDACTDPRQLPQWLKEEDLGYYAKEFARTGFRGGLTWYRAQDSFWRSTPFLAGRKLLQPTLYVGGTDDVVYLLAKAGVDHLEQSADDRISRAAEESVAENDGEVSHPPAPNCGGTREGVARSCEFPA
jgi:pimeloyl-ACP methyl ester carboxylesterase